MKKILFLFFLITLTFCVAQSGTNQRYEESMTLGNPNLNISLSNNRIFNFAIVGDIHIGGDTERLNTILSRVQAEGDSFIILLGDIVDKGVKDDFILVKNLLNNYGYNQKTLFVIGNHDIFYDGWTHFKEQFGSSVYQVTIGNSKFISLDTADGTVGEKQFDWLKNILSQPKSENTFLLSHYLPYVPGQRTYLKLADELEAAKLMKLVTNHQVKGWLGGHYHSFAQEDIEGVKYVVAGGGGGRRMEPVLNYFYVQVQVNGEDINYQLKTID